MRGVHGACPRQHPSSHPGERSPRLISVPLASGSAPGWHVTTLINWMRQLWFPLLQTSLTVVSSLFFSVLKEVKTWPFAPKASITLGFAVQKRDCKTTAMRKPRAMPELGSASCPAKKQLVPLQAGTWDGSCIRSAGEHHHFHKHHFEQFKFTFAAFAVFNKDWKIALK